MIGEPPSTLDFFQLLASTLASATHIHDQKVSMMFATCMATLFHETSSRLSLGWTLKPVEKYQYIGSLITAIRENIQYPRGLPSVNERYQLHRSLPPEVEVPWMKNGRPLEPSKWMPVANASLTWAAVEDVAFRV